MIFSSFKLSQKQPDVFIVSGILSILKRFGQLEQNKSVKLFKTGIRVSVEHPEQSKVVKLFKTGIHVSVEQL
jgi:hypothetical protein